MGLRLAEGVALARLAALAGAPLDRVLRPAALERFVADGWLVLNDGRLIASAGGRQRLNGILAALLERTPAPAGAAAQAR